MVGDGRRRQVAPGRGGARLVRRARSSAAAASPTARGSPTGRWSRSSSSSTRCPRTTRRPRRSARCSARRTRRRSAEEIAWAFRKLLEEQAAAGRRLRRHPVGRGDLPRPARARRASLVGRADPAALHGASGAARAPGGVAGDRFASSRSVRSEADELSGAAMLAPSCASGSSRRRRQPAVRRGDGWRWQASGRRGRRAADDPGAARRPPRPARPPSEGCSSEARSRARCSIVARCRRLHRTKPR